MSGTKELEQRIAQLERNIKLTEQTCSSYVNNAENIYKTHAEIAEKTYGASLDMHKTSWNHLSWFIYIISTIVVVVSITTIIQKAIRSIADYFTKNIKLKMDDQVAEIEKVKQGIQVIAADFATRYQFVERKLLSDHIIRDLHTMIGNSQKIEDKHFTTDVLKALTELFEKVFEKKFILKIDVPLYGPTIDSFHGIIKHFNTINNNPKDEFHTIHQILSSLRELLRPVIHAINLSGQDWRTTIFAELFNEILALQINNQEQSKEKQLLATIQNSINASPPANPTTPRIS